MKIFVHHFCSFVGMLVVTSALSVMTTSVYADTWRGTAPFCAGECLANETKVGVSDYGDGGYCVTGHKVLCRNNQPSCPVRETKTSCYGAVMICDNGFHESPTQNWHSCDKYACGVCLGISISSTHTLSYTADTCKQGFVWREATKDDHVCVIPATRTQAANDNRSAASRRAGGGASGPDTCKQGFVWREVIPSDHVCVTPEIRTAVAADNRLSNQRREGAQPGGDDTCKQGFVWREAIKNDHVCVTPPTRTQAANDNRSAAERRAGGGASGPDTCKSGFVWREVVPSDHVCVAPNIRTAVVADNRAAEGRKVGH